MAYTIVSSTDIANSQTAIGIQLPFNGSHGLFSSTYSSIDQAISNLRNLLLTMKGERLHQPTFGTDLMRLIFEPSTEKLKELVTPIITDPVTYWLPYIQIVEILTTTAQDNPTLDHDIIIKISFNIVNSTVEDSLQTITLFVSNNQLTVETAE
jgi:phage baseplate assembly protein W